MASGEESGTVAVVFDGRPGCGGFGPGVGRLLGDGVSEEEREVCAFFAAHEDYYTYD